MSVVLALRRMRMPGFLIDAQSGISRATVSRIPRRHGLSKLRSLELAKPVRHNRREHRGEVIHLDIKNLGGIVRPSHRVAGNRRDRVVGTGWEYVHGAIDGVSRIAFALSYPEQCTPNVLSFLHDALALLCLPGRQDPAPHEQKQFRLYSPGPTPPTTQTLLTAKAALILSQNFRAPHPPLQKASPLLLP